MPAMGSLADVTLGDIGRALGRYRPVAITVAIILVVLAVVPGPRKAALRSLSSVPPPAAAASEEPATVSAGDEASAGTVPADEATTFDSSSSSSSSFSSGSSGSSSDFSSDSSDFSDGSSSSDFSSAPSPSFDFSSDDGPSTTPGSSLRPLTIVAAGWASAGGGTPLGSTGVPASALPVAKRIGQVDKYSFVRLEGEQKVLSVKVNPEGGRTTTGDVGVSICQITEGGWAEGENVPSDAAPAYDAATCVAGDPGDGTAWLFNLVTFSSPADPRGFALVPTGESIDYQINFSRS